MSLKIERILIANRGEIALRVMQTCREMEIQTVSLYTDEEKDLPHAFVSDQSVCLGNGPLSETYLNQKRIVEIAKKWSCDAIHPGYGFLSENPEFAELLQKEGIKLIGPSSFAMKSMGDKITSKIMMEKINVPLIPGYHGENQDSDFLKKEASKMSYPILIKATAGGGGKGMRIVHKKEDFFDELAAAQREAQNAFGNDKVLIEKFIENPRHIEIQVMSDSHGNHLHLFERECSIQRRYQKVIEESPSPVLKDSVREKMAAVAVKITREMNYEGAGTLEFILDEDQNFYFLEMNTRLQVEHPVTEMVTGLDLVKMQIEVAKGEKLRVSQKEITQTGHAIEVRLYAEDPDNEFLPSIGRIDYVGRPSLRNVRLETGYHDGNEVGISFDPMLAKLVVHGASRDEAILKMKKTLLEVPFLGVKTNRNYLDRILSHKAFIKGETFTHFVKTHEEELAPKKWSKKERAQALGAYFCVQHQGSSSNEKVLQNGNSWDDIQGFRL